MVYILEYLNLLEEIGDLWHRDDQKPGEALGRKHISRIYLGRHFRMIRVSTHDGNIVLYFGADPMRASPPCYIPSIKETLVNIERAYATNQKHQYAQRKDTDNTPSLTAAHL